MRAVLDVRHSAIADFEHVRIVPVPRSRVRLESRFLVENRQDTVGTATPILPFLLPSPAVADVARRAPQVSPDFFSPQPRLGFSPFANTEYDRAPGSV